MPLVDQLAGVLGFKSCPRVGGIPTRPSCSGSTLSFKSCPRVGGILPSMFIWPGTCGFQVVPPCGGHLAPALLCGHAAVSSRAPVWGASAAEHFARDSDGRFKSCPRVGGIPRRQRNGRLLPSFKSCPRVGGIVNEGAENQRDPGFKSCPRVGGICIPNEGTAYLLVSSRAPVWGASTICSAYPSQTAGFKSCPRVGGICDSSRGPRSDCSFKSCPRVGGICRSRATTPSR